MYRKDTQNMNRKIKNKKFEWLFIFIIYSDYSHDDSTDVMKEVKKGIFETLKYVRINNNSKIVIIHNEMIESQDLTICGHLVKCHRGKNNIRTLEYMTRDKRFLMEKQRALGGRIKELNERFPAQKHCIITCDHGSI